jgi:hypothetical protein
MTADSATALDSLIAEFAELTPDQQVQVREFVRHLLSERN